VVVVSEMLVGEEGVVWTAVTCCMIVAASSIAVALWFARWRSRAEKHLAATTYRAALAEKALGDQGMLANEVAHELKNPVTAIVCAAQTLEMLLDSTLDRSQRSALRHIKEHGEYVLKLMQDFIDVTRGACGYLKSCKQAVQAGQVAQSVVGILNPIAAKKRIEIQLRISEENPWISVDPKHLKQILFNVVHNAIKFTPNGGRITVSVGKACSEHAQVVKPICITVKDSGRGISTDRLEKIFDARTSFRGTASVNAASTVAAGEFEEGCGLGLPLTKTLVDLEGGEIYLQSVEGVGTEVTVLFKALEQQALKSGIAAESQQDTERFPLSGQRVLVVEDDAALRDVVSELIRALGGVVDGVGEAVQALEAVQKTPYSAVVIDEYVGGLTGKDVARLIQREEGAREARIVFTSSSAAENESDSELQIATETIEKPFDSQVLISSLLQR
jgi:signal transduction histidine kinase